MSRTTNMQKVINSILFHSCLTKQEVVEVFNEIGSGDDTALSESMLEIDSRYSKSVSESEERLAKLEQEHEAKLFTHAKQHTEKLLAMEHQIATMVASRNVALKRTDDPEELEAIYAMYDPKIYKTKLERQEMVDKFKMLKDVLYREWQEKKRAELISQRESKISFDKERIKARRDYHEHKRQVVAKWLDVINERESAKGGAA